MKRFRWGLQRLLDVTCRRESTLRAELMKLSRELADLRRQIFEVQARLRTLLEELAAQSFDERAARQRLVMDHSAAQERMIDEMKARLRAMEALRTQRMEQLLAIRKSRQMLEKLRDNALQKHALEMRRAEQKQLDEVAGNAFARKMPGKAMSTIDGAGT
jgi:flagellar export protein FliJ